MKEKFKHYSKQIARYVKRLRIRKMHLDYLAGLLTIPVLITAILINYGNLNKLTPAKVAPTPEVTNAPTVVQQQVITPNSSCKKTVGPVAISYPAEGQTVTDNPICITINYVNPNYCAVVWSYRINGGNWSAFSTDSPCLYNLPNGNVQFQLQVNSTSSTDQKTLVRNFIYTGANNPTATPVPSPTPTPIQPTIASASATQK